MKKTIFLTNILLRYPHLVRMAATSGDARVGVGYDLTKVFRGDRTALVGGVGIVIECHKTILFYNGFGPCYSFFATEFCFLRHLDVSLTTLESGFLVQRLQQLLIGFEVNPHNEFKIAFSLDSPVAWIFLPFLPLIISGSVYIHQLTQIRYGMFLS